jgi:hypothetical protein
MPNLEVDTTKTKLKSLLKLNTREANSLLDTCFEMATEQVLREYKAGIGKRVVRHLKILYKSYVASVTEEMCYVQLPADCRSVDSLFYGNTKIKILTDGDQYLKWQKSDLIITEPFVGFIQQTEDGAKVVDLYPPSAAANGGTVDLVYNVNGKDFSVFPEQYQRLIMYCTAKEYLLWDTLKRDPAIHNKINSEYKIAKGELTLDQLYQGGETVDRHTLEEQRWFDGFNDLGYARNTDVGY